MLTWLKIGQTLVTPQVFVKLDNQSFLTSIYPLEFDNFLYRPWSRQQPIWCSDISSLCYLCRL